MPRWRGPVDRELDAEEHRGVAHRAHAHPRRRAEEGPVRAGPRRRRAKACVQNLNTTVDLRLSATTKWDI